MIFLLCLLHFFLLCVSASPRRLKAHNVASGCDAKAPDAFLELLDRPKTADFSVKAAADGTPQDQDPIVIEVYFHVMSFDGTEAKGNFPDSVYSAQMAQLNTDYNIHDISFVLKGITRHVMPFAYSGGVDLYLKKQLRVGGWATLNIYTLYIGGGVVGLGHYPYDPAQFPIGSDEYYRDGVVISIEALPGIDPTGDRNLGKTATHEVGHWLGLQHTFENGCDGTGDGIDDTPAMKPLGAGGCPVGSDSCPGLEGFDPVRNYMSYSNDECIGEFSSGQVERMKWSWEMWRKGQ